jgi:hypothetical protein
VLRLEYDFDQAPGADEAISRIRERLAEGWRVTQIRGPQHGPFEVAYLREVHRAQ